jgi:hypothetical protein
MAYPSIFIFLSLNVDALPLPPFLVSVISIDLFKNKKIGQVEASIVEN